MTRSRDLSVIAWIAALAGAALLARPFDAAAGAAYTCRTKSHLVVVSEVAANRYEYRSWKTGKSTSDRADLVVRNGELSIQGTGPCRSRYWIFRNGKYRYSVTDTLACMEAIPPANAVGQLSVSVDGDLKAQWWCIR